MKESELREAATCGLCNKKIGQSGVPLFMRVNVQRHGLLAPAIQRQQGLAMMLGGNGLLASVMGPNDNMTDIISENTITVCEICAQDNPILYQILELKEDD